MVWDLLRTKKEKPAAGKTGYWRTFWRRRWDSNPRTLADQTISSRSRYDHFDTSPYLSQHQHLRKRGELMGRTKKNIQLKTPEKPRKIKGFRSGSYQIATTISSRSRYDHFDTSPYLSQHQHLRKRGELMGRTKKNIKLKIPEKPRKIKGFRLGGYRIATTISSRSRYDLFDSPPCISTVFRALRKCKKNRQERYEILKLELGKTLINQGFSAEKTARANAHFESALL